MRERLSSKAAFNSTLNSITGISSKILTPSISLLKFLAFSNLHPKNIVFSNIASLKSAPSKFAPSKMAFLNFEFLNLLFFKLVPINEVKVDLDNQENGYLKIYPNIHDIDGFFIAKLERVR